FRVTPKGRTAGGRRPTHVPRPLSVVLGLSVLALAWYALTLMGATPTIYAIPWAVHAAVFWMLVNVALVWLAIRRIRSSRFASERRSSVRFETDLPGRLDGIEGWVRDLSLTGARLELSLAAVLAPDARLHVETRDGTILEFAGSVRTRWTDTQGRGMAGFEFAEGQYHERARLALALFGATARKAASDIPEHTVPEAALVATSAA
ncbi:MAG: PilZ domain-containing protein, partial [Candidatus Limnocylindrales bacterium]